MTGLTCGVVGAGVFGGYHAGKYDGLERVRLAGIHDRDPERAAAMAAKFPGAQVFASLEALLEACEAVTIASVASVHAEQARAALEAGRHVLVEKPLALTGAKARALAETAAAKGLQLHVDHQERFVAKAAGLLDASPPRRIAAHRLGPGGARGGDVSVVMDLMTHDLDLALRLIGSAPETVEAAGDADELRAAVRFANGAEATFHASRRAPAPDRGTRLEWESGAAEIDFVAKTLVNESAEALDPGFADHPEARDSLGANVAAFVASVLDGTPAMVPGREAAEAAALAERIERAAGI